jgi:hypothetical protein
VRCHAHITVTLGNAVIVTPLLHSYFSHADTSVALIHDRCRRRSFGRSLKDLDCCTSTEHPRVDQIAQLWAPRTWAVNSLLEGPIIFRCSRIIAELCSTSSARRASYTAEINAACSTATSSGRSKKHTNCAGKHQMPAGYENAVPCRVSSRHSFNGLACVRFRMCHFPLLSQQKEIMFQCSDSMACAVQPN